MNCFDNDCTCDCYNDNDNDNDDDDDGEDLPDEVVNICDSTTAHFNPAPSCDAGCDYAELLVKGLERIESTIEGLSGDPGRCYPLDERLWRTVDASRVRRR